MPNPLASARRAAIDNELAELSRKVALLKAERNSLAPIATLPNELLVRILAAFTAGTAVSMRQPSTLAKLMFVCRHWANIIAAFPTLWDEITLWSLPSRRSLEAQLLRSGGAPVGIYILQFSSFHYTPLILANVARIKALDLAGERSNLVEFLQAMQEVDFPMLCSLALIAYESAQPVPDVHLPRDLFRRMPSLCNLELREIDVPWEHLPPLRSLRLSAKNPTRPPSRMVCSRSTLCPQTSPRWARSWTRCSPRFRRKRSHTLMRYRRSLRPTPGRRPLPSFPRSRPPALA
ncbi:hypothetical protein B0H16DRAFT_1510420 [Mycena metata]|uniref:F-box domain-containing protein n=1 Tax=Mycena metata TaxID=1033252 RepID=A0AAD7JXG9_9AGAR|nr:hypothetical protein B0H16DRAFT_1510420 [Mycena metata]